MQRTDSFVPGASAVDCAAVFWQQCLRQGFAWSGCQGKNVETMAAFAEKEGAEDGTGAADSVDGEFGMSNESGAETTVDGDTAANPGASTGSVEDAATVKELNRVKVKGIYVSGPMAGTAGMDNLISLVDRTELNALVIDVKNDDGYLTCELDVPLAEQIGSEKHYIKDLPALVQTCKEKNIYLIARVVAFKDPILAEKMPEWSLHNSDGSVFRDKSRAGMGQSLPQRSLGISGICRGSGDKSRI